MSWLDELRRDGATPCFCLEVLQGGNVIARYSDLGYSDVNHNWWEPLITSIQGINNAINMDQLEPMSFDIEIPLRNEDGNLQELLSATREFSGCRGNLYVKYVDHSGTEQSQQILGGIIEISDNSGPESLAIVIRSSLSDRLGQFCKITNKAGFANIREQDVGRPMNILTGTATSTDGVVSCPMIDTGLFRFLAAQGKIRTIRTVYRHRSDQVSTLAGGQWTSGFATDGEGNDHTWFQLVSSGDYQDGDDFFIDYDGIEDVGDGSGAVILNPADMCKELIIRFTPFGASDLDTTAFSEWATRMTTLGLDVSGVSSICIPWDGSPPSNPLDILREIGASFNQAFYINGDGQISTCSADVSVLSDLSQDAPPQLWDQFHLGAEDISIHRKGYSFFNKAIVFYGSTQSAKSKFAGSFTGLDTGSKTYFNEEIEANVYLRFIRDETAAQKISRLGLLRSAGMAKRVEFPVANLEALQFQPGQRCLVSHENPGADILQWSHKEFIVSGVELEHQSLTSKLHLCEVGKTYGPIKFSGQASISIPCSLDTYVRYHASTTAYGSAGHLYHGLPGDEPHRIGWIIPLDSLPPGATILEASMVFHVLEANNDRPGGWAQPVIRILTCETFGNNSTYAAFADNGAGAGWSESYLSTIIGIFGDLRGGGYREAALYSAGISYLNTKFAATTKEAYLSLEFGNDPNEYCKLTSLEGGIPAELRLVYQY